MIVSNSHVRDWIAQCADLCQPDRIVHCNNSASQRNEFLEQAVSDGTLIRLNQQKLPGCYLHRSNPNDVARSEQLTFICGPSEDLAGPTNNFLESKAAYAKLRGLFHGCMKGRTMYVIPFLMGPAGSPLARVGVQLTDSIYVALSMGIMTRMGPIAWNELGNSDDFTRCLHSLGDVNPDRRFICHFPLDNTVWSFGSGYGGNALLGKKCLALRIASYLGRQQGWMAEHMLLMGAQSPPTPSPGTPGEGRGGGTACGLATNRPGEKTYLAAAFPSGCGKTNFAMLIPPPEYSNWKITTVGDDIVWMWVDEKSGKLRAINPEAGYFGVLPGTSEQTNPNAMACIQKDTIFTNAALLPDGDVWWEGKTPDPPAHCIDWMGQPWTPQSGQKAAHPNSRFTSPATNNPALDPAFDDPAGVEVSAIIFGGRRSRGVPLVYQAFNWIHGVYLGATLGSETTAAATGATGIVRRDPMAMLPFIGYNIRDYLVHWFRMRKKMRDCPRIFHVNWFRKDDQGHFMWPGFGQNMRVLDWIIRRAHGHAYAYETPLGWMPRVDDINLTGIDVTTSKFEALQHVNHDEFKAEIMSQEELFLKLAGDLPKEMVFQRELLISRL
jgi:phosphoenolpyruvate carboxykinase (GTP)